MAVLTFKDLYTEVLTRRDQASDTGQGLTLAKYAVQQAHEKLLLSDRWSFMLWPVYQRLQFQTGIRNYTLHPLAAMLTDFQNDTAKQLMKETPTRARYKTAVSLGVQQDRYHFEFVQDSPVITPFATGKFTINGHAQIRYVDTSGNVQNDDLTNAQTTQPVQMVFGVTKMDQSTLQITDANSQVILTLATTEFGKNYPQIQLFDDGVGSEVGIYRFYRRPYLLTNDNDVPEIPYPYSRILVFSALLDLAAHDDDKINEYWAGEKQEWDTRLRQAYQEGEMEGAEVRTIQESDLYGG